MDCCITLQSTRVTAMIKNLLKRRDMQTSCLEASERLMQVCRLLFSSFLLFEYLSLFYHLVSTRIGEPCARNTSSIQQSMSQSMPPVANGLSYLHFKIFYEVFAGLALRDALFLSVSFCSVYFT